MVLNNFYHERKDICYFDSSNVYYSECYDHEGPPKHVKVVFKQGRTYLYKNVTNEDYVAFRNAQSNGSEIYRLKQYDVVRLEDTSLEKLEEQKKQLLLEQEELRNTTVEKLFFHISYDNESGRFILYQDKKPVYWSTEGQVSIINLFRAMSLNYSMDKMTDEEKEKINNAESENN